ncbi:hypothetical protein AGRO_0482 [Agrobacterium sp. ATCC 31749]|jgi:hypothetical protein|nr:hypothetical protein AGRO_0482 [Agrobacterium sp. ATCC 31749]KJX89214.1 hypothetical protein SY94_0700 [Agrobacterium tumefaciens]
MLGTPQRAVYIAVQHNCGKLRARIAAKAKYGMIDAFV